MEQYSNAPTSDMYSRWRDGSISRFALVESAASTCLGRSSEAGAWFTWNVEGTPSGKYDSTRDSMYLRCDRRTHPWSTAMSTFSKSETGPSSSTFQRCARSWVNESYRDPLPPCV
eukprot:2870258-Pleurochrysis_carterae.AAC.1